MKKTFTYFFLFFLPVPLLYPQRMPERMIIFNPLFNTEKNAPAGETLWMNSISGWGEFGNYFSENDGTHEWYQKLGMFFELFRISDRNSLSLLSNIEFIADPHNDINFNPRAIFWEEAVLYSQQTGISTWQAGYYHRCKHDIDNLAYGTERSLIYGSIMGRYIYPAVRSERINVFASLRGDIYTILQDYRTPVSPQVPNLENLVHSLALNATVENAFMNFISYSASAFVQMNSFSSYRGFFKKFINISYIKPSAGFEMGLFLTGQSRLGITLRYEYFKDTGLDVLPSSADLLSAGLSFYPGEIK